MERNSKNKKISSSAQYLTFIASTGGSDDAVEMRYEGENIWLTQRMMAELYGVDVRTINYHIKRVYADRELDENRTIQNYWIVQTEGSREVEREVKHYNLQVIIAVGFKVDNERAIQFRKWAGQIVKDYTIQGWVMDAERLKKGANFTDEYFERQLEKIREIRASERKFYQKITDIYVTSSDYDNQAKSTRRFFATVQNKLHWAIHGHTAAEVILERADVGRENMGLTSWQDAPEGKIQKSDVIVAKNYLEEDELKALDRIVTMYLDYAESMAERKIPMTMEDWEKRLNAFLQFNEREVLQDAGKVRAEIAKSFALAQFEKYRVIQDRAFKSDFDRFLETVKEEEKREDREGHYFD